MGHSSAQNVGGKPATSLQVEMLAKNIKKLSLIQFHLLDILKTSMEMFSYPTLAAILDWWYTPENERLQPKNKHHPIEKKRETMKNHGKKEKPNKSPRKYHLPSTSFFGFQPCPTASPTADCRLPCHLWCWHGANLTWKTAAGQGEISKFWPWKWEYSTYSSPLIVAIFHKNDKMWVK